MCVYIYIYTHTCIYIHIYIYTRTIARASRALRFHLFRSPAYSAEEGTPPKKGGTVGFEANAFVAEGVKGGSG